MAKYYNRNPHAEPVGSVLRRRSVYRGGGFKRQSNLGNSPGTVSTIPAVK